MRAVPDRDRWLALGLLAATLAVGYLLLVHPWWTVPMRQVSSSIETLQQRELQARMQLQQRDTVEQRLLAARALEAQAPVFLPEKSVELASAGLVQRLDAVVSQVDPGGRACAISNRSPTASRAAEGRFERVTVRVRMRCGNAQTAEVLHILEGGTPLLFVDNLNIMALGRYTARSRLPQANEGGVDVEFELYGFLQPRPASVSTPGVADAG